MKKNTTAFTLIELVIVVVLLGILSAVALPKFLDLSADAYRALNNSTVTALNVSVTNVMGNARFGTYGTYENYKDINTTYMTSVVGSQYNIYTFVMDNTNNPLVGLWLTKSYFPIGSSSSTTGVGGDYTTGAGGTYGGYVLGNNTTAAIQGTCADIFNLLVNNSSVNANFSGYTSWGGLNIIPAPRNSVYTVMGLGATMTGANNSATVTTVLTPSSMVINGIASTGTTGGATPIKSATSINITTPTTPGGCLYQLTASANTGTVFYIYYSAGLFTAVEVQ